MVLALDNASDSIEFKSQVRITSMAIQKKSLINSPATANAARKAFVSAPVNTGNLATAKLATARMASAKIATAKLATAKLATAKLATAKLATAKLATAKLATAKSFC